MDRWTRAVMLTFLNEVNLTVWEKGSDGGKQSPWLRGEWKLDERLFPLVHSYMEMSILELALV